MAYSSGGDFLANIHMNLLKWSGKNRKFDIYRKFTKKNKSLLPKNKPCMGPMQVIEQVKAFLA